MTQSSEDWQLKQKIGQMIVVRTSGHLFDHQIRYPIWEADHQTLQKWIQELNLGGVILLGGSGAEVKIKTQTLQNWAKTPLLICADIEEGVGQRFAGGTWFPPPMALGEIAQKNLELAQSLAYKMGKITAKEALTLGINWLLAPVVDVNNNPHNPVINIRAFAEDPMIVSKLATSFLQGTQAYSILTTAKHFPGHGNTATDSHLDLPHLPQFVEDLETIEIPPFQAAIQAKVDSIMTAHLLVKAWDKDVPATLSKKILTDQLRHKLGFKGLIVTDALVMGGVKNHYSDEEIALKAVEAGVDILLMPSHPEVAINGILDGVKSGRLSSERIEVSWHRIQQAKQKIIPSSDSLDIFSLSADSSMELVNEVLENSLQVEGKLPLNSLKNGEGKNLIVVDDLLNMSFLDRQSPALTIPQQYGYRLQLIESQYLSDISEISQPTLLQIFLRGNPFRGKAGLNQETQEIYQRLLKKGIIKALVIYGSPYIKEWFQQQNVSNIPLLFSYGQMPQSQKIICQKLFNLLTVEDKKLTHFGF